MSNDYSFSYSLNPTPVETQRVSSGDSALYAFEECDSLPIPSGTLLVSRRNGARLALAPDVAVALQHCMEFRTLDDHAKVLIARLPQLKDEIADVLRVLAAVRDAGLMLSADTVCERVNGDFPRGEKPAPSVVCIITCDRPAALNRLLDSMMRGAALARHSALFVVDDSRAPANQAQNRELVERFAQAAPLPMHYMGASEQRDMVEALVQQAPEAERGIRFGLDRDTWNGMPSYGLSRNFSLLLSVGQRCIVLDDDVLCQALRTPLEKPGVRIGDGLRDAAFFQQQDHWEKATQAAEFDPLEGHKQCLGLSLGAALGTLGNGPLQPEQLQGAFGSQFTTISAASPILVSQCGSFGDPGTQGNNWLSRLDPDSRDRMLRQVGLQGALSNRQCWLGQIAPRISRRAVMSQVTGLDNSAMLPPYFPVFRGEDQLFGAMLTALHPHALAIEYSWGVPHLPLPERQGNPDGDLTVPIPGLRLLDGIVTDETACNPSLPLELRWSHLVQLIEELAHSSDERIEARFASRMTLAQAATLQGLTDQLRSCPEGADDWREYLQRCVNDNVQALQSELSLVTMPGLPDGMEAAAVADAAREFAGGFAELLRHWPELRRASREYCVSRFA